MMKIGHLAYTHMETRNIVGKVSGCEYKKVFNIGSIIAGMPNKVSRRIGMRLPNDSFARYIISGQDFRDFDLNRVDVLHFFNEVSHGKTPWVATFGRFLPRQSYQFSLLAKDERAKYISLLENWKLAGLEAVCGDACERIIALSDWSFGNEQDLLHEYPQFRFEIERKLIRLHPPQAVLINDYESKQVDPNGQLRFMFVGNEIHRKGGLDILEAFVELREHYGDALRLILVSSMKPGRFDSNEVKQEIRAAGALIQNNEDWIDYRKNLPNREVLELMKTAHVGLLPTYADVYGYSVLEFQACGCPVISTNVSALPEINNDSTGWVINIGKSNLDVPYYRKDVALSTDVSAAIANDYDAERRSAVKEGLVAAISEIMEDRASIRAKGVTALNRIRDQHSPVEHARILEQIYRQALD